MVNLVFGGVFSDLLLCFWFCYCVYKFTVLFTNLLCFWFCLCAYEFPVRFTDLQILGLQICWHI